ncbi:Rv1733c family protein [Mycolicibacterium komossense]|uniref:Transmembrane protein n=1 Tax=Mycolicibacterium komossense TaxID=1779 RepID=A0ABT3CJD3_9MYCO|nr:hypothetical protein [Mycolicibacterium komossense]MCV7229599.1 hypothetical protein [Mycolicibacterium komossense]
MEFFTLDWGRSWLARLFGRNALVRNSDRLEALIIALAVVAVIVAIPVAAGFGTSVKESRSTAYAQQALSRHRVTATALENAELHAQIYTQTFSVQARWAAAGAIHVGNIPAPEMVHVGDRLVIWTDDSGNYAKNPIDPRQAVADAIGWAAFTWMSFTAILAIAVYGLRRNLRHTRFSQWDRELDALVGDGGGRTSH